MTHLRKCADASFTPLLQAHRLLIAKEPESMARPRHHTPHAARRIRMFADMCSALPSPAPRILKQDASFSGTEGVFVYSPPCCDASG